MRLIPIQLNKNIVSIKMRWDVNALKKKIWGPYKYWVVSFADSMVEEIIDPVLSALQGTAQGGYK